MKKLPLLLLLPFVVVTGCSKGTEDTATSVPLPTTPAAGPSEDTAEASVRYIMDGIKNGQPVVIWNALPESYQTDVNGLVRTFGESMDPEIWKQSIGMIGSIHKLLVDKGELIANYPAVASGENAESAKEAIPQVAGLLKTILDSTSDLEKLKTFDGGEFMTTTGSSLVKQVEAISKLAPQGPDSPKGLAALDDVQIETVESTDTTATLKMTSPDGKEETQEFVKVDGKWLPSDLVEDWDESVAKAKEGLAQLPDQIEPMRGQVMMASGMVNGMLSPLQNAEDQEQFNSAMDGLVQSAMGMFMGGMGGPPPGSFGPPPGDAPDDSASPEPASPEPASPEPASPEPASPEPASPELEADTVDSTEQ